MANFKPPLFVYQMGKVGSQSIFYSLKNINYFPIAHFHYLRQEKTIHPLNAKFIELTPSYIEPMEIVTTDGREYKFENE